ncbi:MAG: carboxymuconolactone decarboxylase family protein [Bacteroidota bacterium]|nr:carboxymuconolactone decarboxylase family protein [Bacteroidota bacterium]
MAWIDLQNDLPGIRGPMIYRPDTGTILNELAEVLLHEENNTLSRGEREMIGAYVSSENDCFFCQNVHGAMAQHYFQCEMTFMDKIKKDFASADISEKLKSLLAIAGSVQKGGKYVTQEQIENAKIAGATDREIHDTVLIAAAFCMFNRYVDGLNTWAPQDPKIYADRAPMRAREGYSQAGLVK